MGMYIKSLKDITVQLRRLLSIMLGDNLGLQISFTTASNIVLSLKCPTVRLIPNTFSK